MLVAMVANWQERKEFGVEAQEGILKIPFLLWFCFFGGGLNLLQKGTCLEKIVCNGGQTMKQMLDKMMEKNDILFKLVDDNTLIIYQSEGNIEQKILPYIL